MASDCPEGAPGLDGEVGAEVNGNIVPPGALLVNFAEGGRLLGIGRRKLWELVNSGAIPHVRIGRRIMFSPASLAAWIAGREEGGRA